MSWVEGSASMLFDIMILIISEMDIYVYRNFSFSHIPCQLIYMLENFYFELFSGHLLCRHKSRLDIGWPGCFGGRYSCIETRRMYKVGVDNYGDHTTITCDRNSLAGSALLQRCLCCLANCMAFFCVLGRQYIFIKGY